MNQKLWLVWQLYHHFGIRWLAYRLSYTGQQKLGLVERKVPASSWSEQPLSQFLINPTLANPERYAHYRQEKTPPFFFHPHQQSQYQPHFAQWDNLHQNPIRTAEQLQKGLFSYFCQPPTSVGIPPRWHQHPLTRQVLPTHSHWSRLSEFSFGDIKWVWELSRFGFTYDLVRAYWRTGDERHPHLFWQLVEDWQQHNPPQQGANWKCGQETSLRLMAWLFGLYGFAYSPATTPQRLLSLAQMIAVSGQRIAENIAYAISQQNNHAISEATGLFTIGSLFPEFVMANHWQQRGRQLLEQLGQELISPDGGFSQHSNNYHRLMLHCFTWSARLAAVQGQPLSEPLLQRIEAAAQFLYQLQEESSGAVPRYGQNDGAWVLPLDNSNFDDYRATVQWARWVCTGQRTYCAGIWDEGLLWLGGLSALEVPLSDLPRSSWQAPLTGYYTIRGQQSWLFIRCAKLAFRPGQADMLHLDLWWRGQNIAIDAGTFSYNAPAPWNNNPLAATRYHNTLTIDGQEQMRRAGRFLWLPWIQGQLEPCPANAQWSGSHNGYRHLGVHYQRSIFHPQDESWLVYDQLISHRPHHYRLHWLLADFSHQWQPEKGELTLHTPLGAYYLTIFCYGWDNEKKEWRTIPGQFSLVRADEQSRRGWYAPRYGSHQPALSLDCTLYTQRALFISQFTPHLL